MTDRDFNRDRQRGRSDRRNRPDADYDTYQLDNQSRARSKGRSSDWAAPGPYTGVGPKGYQRKDERILDEVNERLTRHGQLDAREVSVGVSGGVVTLQGTVNSRREKHIAEYLAESVSGVQDVDNQLRVGRMEERREQSRRGNEQSRREAWKAPGEARQEDQSFTAESIPNTGRQAGIPMGGVPQANAQYRQGGTEGRMGASHAPQDMPDRVRGEGMTPGQESSAMEDVPPARAVSPAQAVSLPEEGKPAGEGPAMEKRANKDYRSEPDPVEGPAAVGAGPTDISSGRSGSTLGDEPAGEPAFTPSSEPIPTTGSRAPEAPDLPLSGHTDLGTQIDSGMQVISSDGEELGKVKDVRYDDFLLDRSMARDVYVPFSACSRVENGQVFLTVAWGEIDDQGWDQPSLL